MSRRDAERGSTRMTLCHARGNTWYFADWQLIPLYRVGDDKCILLDTGLLGQRSGLELALQREGLTPIGILGSHVHTDHSPNHRYFQQKYHIPVALSLGEAGLCATRLNLKAYFSMLSPLRDKDPFGISEMELLADRVIGPYETEIDFCGVAFGILHTPGHSPDHLSIRTPDDVLYLGDALMTEEELAGAKLPYYCSICDAIESMERLRSEQAAMFLAAHRGVCTDIRSVIDANIAAIHDRAEQLLALLDHPMTPEEWESCACCHFRLLSNNVSRAKVYRRNIRLYMEYLQETGQVTATARRGTVYYSRANAPAETGGILP